MRRLNTSDTVSRSSMKTPSSSPRSSRDPRSFGSSRDPPPSDKGDGDGHGDSADYGAGGSGAGTGKEGGNWDDSGGFHSSNDNNHNVDNNDFGGAKRTHTLIPGFSPSILALLKRPSKRVYLCRFPRGHHSGVVFKCVTARELTIMNWVTNHPRFPPFHTLYSPPSAVIMMPYLGQVISHAPVARPKLLYCWTADILDGMNWLHGQRIAHLDIKPDNC